MKKLFNLSILAICSMIILGLTSCEQQEVMNEAMGPQFSGPSIEDLDLSEGFQGTYSSTPGGDYDFAIRNHNPMYPFIQGRGDENLDGVCTIRVEFQSENSTLDVTQVDVSDILLSYTSGNATIEQPAAYTWGWPYLDIYTAYTNVQLNYDIAIANNLGDSISILETVVTGGLCVIQNIDHLDPIKQVSILDGNQVNK